MKEPFLHKVCLDESLPIRSTATLGIQAHKGKRVREDLQGSQKEVIKTHEEWNVKLT